MVTDIGPSTVDLVAVRDSTRYPFQRKGFYAKGYHFEFYYADSKIYWRRSADGVTWGSGNDITPSGETPTDGSEIAVWLDRHEEPAHHPYVVWADKDSDSDLYFRRATIDDAGNLTWDAAWQTAVTTIAGTSFRNPTICVDDVNGYPFIGYTRTIRADPSSGSRPWVTHSQQMDGTWSTFVGGPIWPHQMNATDNESWVCIVVPSGGVTMTAVYVRDSFDIKYDLYNVTGDAWLGEAATGVTMGADATKVSVTSQREGKNTALDPKRIHIAYCAGDENLNYISIDAVVGVTGPILVYNSTIAMGPSISTRIYGSGIGTAYNHYRTLYIFWTPITDAPTADKVCYKKSIDDGANWTKEDGSTGVELWVDETGAGLSGVNTASSYFEEQHHSSRAEGYLGVLYTNEGASPDYVRWAGIAFADPDEELLCHAKIRHPASAELSCNFVIRKSASADLAARIDLINLNVELKVRFEVGQGSAVLFGKAVVRHDGIPVELLAKLVVRHDGTPVELYGKGVIRHDGTPVELYGKGVIRHDGTPAELLGKGVVRHDGTPVELLGKFVVRHDGTPIELYGKFVVRHDGTPIELLGKFRITTDEWVVQCASLEAYIALDIVV